MSNSKIGHNLLNLAIISGPVVLLALIDLPLKPPLLLPLSDELHNVIDFLAFISRLHILSVAINAFKGVMVFFVGAYFFVQRPLGFCKDLFGFKTFFVRGKGIHYFLFYFAADDTFDAAAILCIQNRPHTDFDTASSLVDKVVEVLLMWHLIQE